MGQARSFPPLARGDARVLILGSMPGVASLHARQYYAHRQNQFWWIMGRLFGAERDLPYAQRVERLLERRVAVWDVLIRRVRAQLGPRGTTLRYARLPSTSPAHAGVPRAAKLRAWRRIQEHL